MLVFHVIFFLLKKISCCSIMLKNTGLRHDDDKVYVINVQIQENCGFSFTKFMLFVAFLYVYYFSKHHRHLVAFRSKHCSSGGRRVRGSSCLVLFFWLHSQPRLFLFSFKAFLLLQQALGGENASFQGSRVLQGEEQQSVRQLQGGGRRGVRPRSPPPEQRRMLHARMQIETRQAVQVQETRSVSMDETFFNRCGHNGFRSLTEGPFVFSDRNSPCCQGCMFKEKGARCQEAISATCKNTSACTGVWLQMTENSTGLSQPSSWRIIFTFDTCRFTFVPVWFLPGNSSHCPPPKNANDNTTCVDNGRCNKGECNPFCEAFHNLQSCACNGKRKIRESAQINKTFHSICPFKNFSFIFFTRNKFKSFPYKTDCKFNSNDCSGDA